MARPLQVIAIDEEPIINYLSQKIVEFVGPQIVFVKFTDPFIGLDHIMQTVNNGQFSRTIVFLDLMMPVKNGWDVLDDIDKKNLPANTPLDIYILSVMMIKKEIALAVDHPFVRSFIDKPLTVAKVKAILEKTEVG